MAGRPRKKAEAVTALEDEALSLEMGMFSEMPEQYLERPDTDRLCTTWNDAMDAVALASTAMEKLGNMLRKKAKISEPGPYEKILVDGGDAHEPVPADWSLVSACVGVVRRRAQVDCDPDGRTDAGVYVPPEMNTGGLISSTNGES
ncbi:MAG: hypothetical protein O7D91_10720 [Planctomycetota bacterium]|nr:hypothetical protein [Planctomycetota bacterium]